MKYPAAAAGSASGSEEPLSEMECSPSRKLARKEGGRLRRELSRTFGMGVIKVSWSTPTLALPHQKVEGIIEEVSNIFG